MGLRFHLAIAVYLGCNACALWSPTQVQGFVVQPSHLRTAAHTRIDGVVRPTVGGRTTQASLAATTAETDTSSTTTWTETSEPVTDGTQPLSRTKRILMATSEEAQ